jgi:hypothetical protein
VIGTAHLVLGAYLAAAGAAVAAPDGRPDAFLAAAALALVAAVVWRRPAPEARRPAPRPRG